MPTTSLRESIVENLKTTIEAIESGSSYFTTVRRVLRGVEPVRNLTETPTIWIWDTVETKELDNISQYHCTLQIDVIAMSTAYESRPQLMTQLLHDVEKAVMADITRGGYAIDTKITGNEAFLEVEAEPLVGITIGLVVDYLHSVTDPSAVT